MSTETELRAGEAPDVGGVVLAGTTVSAAVATFLVTPGSGVGPAALAFFAWLAVLWAASWAAFVDDVSSVWHRVGAVAFAATISAGFVETVESAWALVFPTVALAAALGRRRSPARFVAAAAWLVVIVHILVGPEL